MKVTRAASIPLVTHDPYFSIWSGADHLYDKDPVHWSQIRQQLRGYVNVDGVVYSFLGDKEFHETIGQTGVDVTATSTTYTATASDLGQFIRLAVTPIATTGSNPGATAYSVWRGPLATSHALAVFHIGNSFTRWGDVPAQLANLAAASNRPHAHGAQLADGQGAGYHWTNGLPGGYLTRGSPSRT